MMELVKDMPNKSYLQKEKGHISLKFAKLVDNIKGRKH